MNLEVSATEDCPHYLALEFHDVQVGPSPDWAQKQLRAIGVQPINNVVDATNLVLHEFGNPLHAFDLDKIEGQSIHVRKAFPNESLTTLDGQERELHENDLVIADQNKAMCLAGVYGGAHSGVITSTTSVMIEAAWFHPVTIRKTARRHGLNTDASFRFERGVDPESVRLAAERCARLIQDWSGARLVGAIEFADTSPVSGCQVDLSLEWLSRFWGFNLKWTASGPSWHRSTFKSKGVRGSLACESACLSKRCDTTG